MHELRILAPWLLVLPGSLLAGADPQQRRHTDNWHLPYFDRVIRAAERQTVNPAASGPCQQRADTLVIQQRVVQHGGSMSRRPGNRRQPIEWWGHPQHSHGHMVEVARRSCGMHASTAIVPVQEAISTRTGAV